MAPAISRPVSLLADLLALGRYDRPIGIWLLAWPCAWGVALARPAPADLAVLCVILLAGSALARAGGCAWNDLVDRNLDASVERTRNRPLAAGRVGPRTALAFIAVHLALAASLLMLLPATAVWLVPASLPLVLLYPLAKRFTWWPQVWLGLTFNWGALVGWSAATGGWPGAGALLLYAGCIVWTVGYDTLYAYQDLAGDSASGYPFGRRSARPSRPRVRGDCLRRCGGRVRGAPSRLPGPARLHGWGSQALASCPPGTTAAVDLEDPDSCGSAFRGAHRAALVWFVGLAADLMLAGSEIVS